jgi:fucose permease
MRFDIGAPLSAAGIGSLIVCCGTVISSLLSNRLLHRFRTGGVTAVSVLMTAFALLGTAYVRSFTQLCLLAIPLGLGAGSVDAALNNFVALHYKAKHMNWLHCFWGLGATSGPMIMSIFLGAGGEWRRGYAAVSAIQFCLAAILFLSLPLWKKAGERNELRGGQDRAHVVGNIETLGIPGIKYALAAFFCYCGFEQSAGLWSTSYLVQRGTPSPQAAAWTAFYFGGITAGRMAAGFLSIKFKGPQLTRAGCALCTAGVVLLLLPLPPVWSLPALISIGLGCAPFYPAMIHETPRRFGEKFTPAAMGLQMASAYMGSMFLPPLVGVLSRLFTMSALPWCLLLLALAMFFFSERTEGFAKYF